MKPEVYRAKTLVLLLLFFTALNALAQHSRVNKYVIIGYVGGYKGLIDTNMVNAGKLTHINYAFVNIRKNRAVLNRPGTDTINFRMLNKLKITNPGLKVLISIGGWTWSTNFSNAALSDTSRKSFAESAVALVKRYHLDGLDIDWEYPYQAGDGNPYRSGDKENYTLLFKTLRAELNLAEKESGKRLLLTAATGGFKGFLEHSEMNKVQKYLSYINLMTYDYFQDSNGVAVHHTGLYASKKYKSSEYAAKAVLDYVAAGVPVSKLVIGIAFYGRSGKVISDSINGLGLKITGLMPSGGYTRIKDSLQHKPGFKYYRDHAAKAAYLFNSLTRQFISFDDEWSVRNKCRFVRKKHLAGIMFWEYADDKKEYLLNQINLSLN